jgi:FG-GAP-like repeat
MGNGFTDLAVGDASGDSSTSTLTVLKNDGAGNFQPAGSYAVGGGGVSIVAADLDHDGHADPAVVAQDPTTSIMTATTLLNDGHGNFPVANSLNLENQVGGLTVSDFHGDANLDLATVNLRGQPDDPPHRRPRRASERRHVPREALAGWHRRRRLQRRWPAGPGDRKQFNLESHDIAGDGNRRVPVPRAGRERKRKVMK